MVLARASVMTEGIMSLTYSPVSNSPKRFCANSAEGTQNCLPGDEQQERLLSVKNFKTITKSVKT
jgi:hypothetical protein